MGRVRFVIAVNPANRLAAKRHKKRKTQCPLSCFLLRFLQCNPQKSSQKSTIPQCNNCIKPTTERSDSLTTIWPQKGTEITKRNAFFLSLLCLFGAKMDWKKFHFGCGCAAPLLFAAINNQS